METQNVYITLSLLLSILGLVAVFLLANTILTMGEQSTALARRLIRIPIKSAIASFVDKSLVATVASREVDEPQAEVIGANKSLDQRPSIGAMTENREHGLSEAESRLEYEGAPLKTY